MSLTPLPTLDQLAAAPARVEKACWGCGGRRIRANLTFTRGNFYCPECLYARALERMARRLSPTPPRRGGLPPVKGHQGHSTKVLHQGTPPRAGRAE